ncbi:MAG TPA: 3-phosphoshikimate 1-carboxyvinyltransferase [Candidatus Cybelea sp.]|nr:3-phosphoshikimate 1-carboxyvinyltransferase [Candidatus Cybelea sp.]
MTFKNGPLRGNVGVPGDKSISHRALICAARCKEPVRISNLNPGRDVAATSAALAALGQRIERVGGDTVFYPRALSDPSDTLDCMNSGSTARMLLGACAGAGVAAPFDGDESLRRRPMEPVAAQLRAFGAKITTAAGRLPLRLQARNDVETRHFILLEPSAQVKSALLFAGLFAGVAVQIDGDRFSRDHSERLLSYLGAAIEWDGRTVALGPGEIHASDVRVAGDFSAAAFFLTAAAVAPGSGVVVENVGINPTRTGLLDALAAMGAAIDVRNERSQGGEPIADIALEHRPLRGIAVDRDLALRAIDELPLLAIAAAFAAGRTTISGIEALRTKESDRVGAIERLLAAAGVAADAQRRELVICGGTPDARGSVLETYGDHRIAMGAAVLACGAGPLEVDSDESFGVSFPGFAEALAALQRA